MNSQTIPAWFVAVMMFLTGVMWLLILKNKLTALVKAVIPIIAITLMVEGGVYLVAFQLYPLDIEFRGFLSRLMIIVLSLSQFVPLAVTYKRSLNL